MSSLLYGQRKPRKIKLSLRGSVITKSTITDQELSNLGKHAIRHPYDPDLPAIFINILQEDAEIDNTLFYQGLAKTINCQKDDTFTASINQAAINNRNINCQFLIELIKD